MLVDSIPDLTTFFNWRTKFMTLENLTTNTIHSKACKMESRPYGRLLSSGQAVACRVMSCMLWEDKLQR